MSNSWGIIIKMPDAVALVTIIVGEQFAALTAKNNYRVFERVYAFVSPIKTGKFSEASTLL